MYWILIEAKPAPADGPPPIEKGAYVSCWINHLMQDGAEVLARYYVEDEGWVVVAVEEVRRVIRADYEGLDEIQYFDEAEREGASLVFNTFDMEEIPPLDERDGS